MLTQIRKSVKSQKGFTLIELMIVVLIIGVIAGIAVPRYFQSTQDARGAKIAADLRTIDSAIVLYQVRNGGIAATEANIVAADTGTLATWPTPPRGTWSVSGTKKTGTVAATDAYTIVNDRGALGKNNAEYYTN